MLVCLQHCSQHLSRLQAGLIHQAVSDIQEVWERLLNDLVKVASGVTHLEAVRSADCEQALETGKDGAHVLRAEQTHGRLEKVWPLLRKVVVEDLLERCYELCANLRSCCSQDGEYALPDSILFGIGKGVSFRLSLV